MKRLVKFTLEDGSTVLIEAEEAEVEEETTRVSRSSTSHEIVNITNQTFEESLGIVKPVANTVLNRLKDISKQPEEVQVSFGISMDLKAGMFIAAGTGANFNVTLTWKS
ncbi:MULTISPECIES: CU044_2847 family protein [Methanosarcina]|uniref:Trypsin-co-occurring domain-containing protein n=3 Tax=Methanosarcina barkeri TaxID=2208 RepID=A0A0E3QUB9_METBA|nr:MULTISPECIES: CU044_2847 family protein [Methanosarcina]AKB54715.1 hypothetical protein MSBRM_1717 [Methanosarcina barkeri MS]AKB57205.1 hypothetical protein MSBR2_0689 [Methanosarcina barkeri 227]AKJ37769.1 hypothetical protein MCM1_0680 [Methanosarcina barkeri CM1]OEC91688.1 hypothetical protein A9239_02680 [Methanosarcina sp. A14]